MTAGVAPIEGRLPAPARKPPRVRRPPGAWLFAGGVEGPVISVRPTRLEEDLRPMARRYFGPGARRSLHREQRRRGQPGVHDAARALARRRLREASAAAFDL